MLASDSGEHTPVGLDSIISTAELGRRRTRAPNHVAENDALIALAEKMASSPNKILQKLAETALNLCHAQTCGISLLESDGVDFCWPALTGVWASHVGAACRAGSVPAARSSTATPHNLCLTPNGTSPTSRRSPRGLKRYC